MLKPLKKIAIAIVISNCFFYYTAYAEESSSPDLTMGFNYSVNFQAYKGHKTSQTLLPTIFYDNDKFYIEGDDAGYYLFKDDKNQLRIDGHYDGNSYDPSGELRLLDKRKWSVLAGASYMRITPYGGFKARLNTDVLSRSKGTILRASYLAELDKGNLTVYPEAGFQWNNAKYNQYYYGVSDAESKRSGIAAYQPGQSISPFVSMTANYQLSKHVNAFSSVEFNYLSNEQFKSPMVKKRTDITPAVGLTFTF
ncbi:MipA/OmpV family protein [Acinetobacter sp. 161(2023)]|uniref:MipA/OmpV family protein n=1 Tax=Acinetobacter sp. 161(2023) TaxID=3098768 RepID=UPI003FA584C0